MNIKFKFINIVLVVCMLCTLLTGCFDRRELDDMAYPVALGFDKGKTNALKMTLQLAVPITIGGEGGGKGEESVTNVTIETPTIYSGLNMLNSFVSKQLNLSHAKVVVISEELAKDGIGKYMQAMIRNREFRPNASIVVSRGPAEEFIKAVKPKLETNPAKYYELLLSAYRYTGFTSESQLINFYQNTKCTCRQPLAVLAGVNKFKSSDEFELSASTYKEKGREQPLEGDFKAGDLTKTGDLGVEIMGLAVFDGGKMVGELDGEETTFHLMVDGKFNSSYVTIPDPKDEDNFVILDIKQSRMTQKKVEMVGGKPKIYAKVILEADILSIQSGFNYERVENIGILETAVENFLKDGILRYLEKSSKVFGTDNCGFGGSMKGKFLTWQECEDFDWLISFKEASFDVEVVLKIRRPGVIFKYNPESRSNE
jgi:spore germination protein KC